MYIENYAILITDFCGVITKTSVVQVKLHILSSNLQSIIASYIYACISSQVHGTDILGTQ